MCWGKGGGPLPLSFFPKQDRACFQKNPGENNILCLIRQHIAQLEGNYIYLKRNDADLEWRQ